MKLDPILYAYQGKTMPLAFFLANFFLVLILILTLYPQTALSTTHPKIAPDDFFGILDHHEHRKTQSTLSDWIAKWI